MKLSHLIDMGCVDQQYFWIWNYALVYWKTFGGKVLIRLQKTFSLLNIFWNLLLLSRETSPKLSGYLGIRGMNGLTHSSQQPCTALKSFQSDLVLSNVCLAGEVKENTCPTAHFKDFICHWQSDSTSYQGLVKPLTSSQENGSFFSSTITP